MRALIFYQRFFYYKKNEKKISNKQYIKIQQQLGSKIDN